MKIDKKLYFSLFKIIIVYYIGYGTVKNLNYVKINSVNRLYLIIHKINGYIKESSENMYLTLVLNDESKYPLEKYKEMWSKIRDLISSITNN